MKIKNLFGMLAMAGMLFATSCSQDDVLNGAAAGDYVEAKFTIETPAAMGTRGATNVGEGTTVNYVACAVYNAEGEELRNLRQYRPITNKTAIYSIRLVKGLGYRVAFFAYYGGENGESAYYDLADMTNIEINAAASNLEERDAFTNYVDVTEEESMNSIVKPVTLNRPFAQLNLGAYAEDIEAAALADIVVEQTEITVSNVYTAFSAYSNKVVGETSEVTFAMNGIPSQKLFVDTDNNESTADDEYEYLALNYLLVGDIDNEKNLTDVTFKWTAANGKSNNPATVFQNIPVQRNYRTNVVGYLLTNSALFNVTIDEKFTTPDYNVIYVGGTSSNPEKLENAMQSVNNNAVKDAVIKVPAGSYVSWTTGSGIGSTPFVSADNAVTKTVTIQGEGENSVMIVDGAGVGSLRAANGAKLIFKDITIVDKSVSYAEGNWEFTYLEFAGNLEFNNVTFKGGISLQAENNDVDLNATFTNCTFITNEESVYAVWVSDGTSTFTNCKFQGTRGLKMHEAYGSEIASVTVDNCLFGPLTKKPGVAIGDLNAETAVTIKNSIFYGCQAGEQGNFKYETDTDVNSFDFVDENNTVESTSDVYRIETAAELVEVIENINNDASGFEGKTVKLEGDIDLSSLTRGLTGNWTPIGTEENVFQGTFDGQGYKIKNLTICDEEPNYFIGFFGCAVNATIKNVTFENMTINVASDNTNEGGHIAGVVAYLAGTSTLENINIIGDVKVESTFENNASSRVGVVVGGNWNDNNDITIKNVNINANDGSYVKANNDLGGIAGQLQGKATFENCSSNIDVIGYKFFAGGLIGIAPANASFTNCDCSGNVSIVSGRAGNANDLYRVGGIAGGWDDNVYTPLVLNNCSYTGTISGKDANGTVATKFDCMGYVGRGYSVRTGSKVVIDGMSFVYKENGAYDITSADGQKVILIYTAEELNKLNAKDALVILNADIDFQGAAMTKPIELWGNSTFDGNNYTISNVKTAVQGGYATSLFRGDANPGNKVVKNLVIENLTTPSGYSFASAIWSDLQGANIEIDNVNINNATIEAVGTVGGFVGFVSASTSSVVIKNSSINNSNLNGGEADHKRGAVVGRAYGCQVNCESVTVNNVKINDKTATTETLVGDKGYTGIVTIK